MTENKKVDFKLTREGLVKIEHKETKGTAEVMPESVPAWMDSGWTVSEPDAPGDRPLVVTVDEEKKVGTVAPAPKEK